MRTLILITALTLAGCAKKAEPVAMKPVGIQPVAEEVPGNPNPNADAAVVMLRENFSRIFFEFDASTLTEESLNMLRENAKILQENPDVRVRIEGHADERGTVDYNLALAGERAQHVHDSLIGMGVAGTQLSVVSYGEEAPLKEGDDERAWSVNRRAEFRVVRDPKNKVDGTIDTPVTSPPM